MLGGGGGGGAVLCKERHNASPEGGCIMHEPPVRLIIFPKVMTAATRDAGIWTAADAQELMPTRCSPPPLASVFLKWGGGQTEIDTETRANTTCCLKLKQLITQ